MLLWTHIDAHILKFQVSPGNPHHGPEVIQDALLRPLSSPNVCDTHEGHQDSRQDGPAAKGNGIAAMALQEASQELLDLLEKPSSESTRRQLSAQQRCFGRFLPGIADPVHLSG